MNGFCVAEDGRDVNEGVIPAPNSKSWSAEQCKSWCETQSGITGCELVVNYHCVKHTSSSIVKANGASNHYCWLTKKRNNCENCR